MRENAQDKIKTIDYVTCYDAQCYQDVALIGKGPSAFSKYSIFYIPIT